MLIKKKLNITKKVDEIVKKHKYLILTIILIDLYILITIRFKNHNSNAIRLLNLLLRIITLFK